MLTLSDALASDFLNLLSSANFVQHANFPTHTKNHTPYSYLKSTVSPPSPKLRELMDCQLALSIWLLEQQQLLSFSMEPQVIGGDMPQRLAGPVLRESLRR